jgi:addiction module HigA family antidote
MATGVIRSAFTIFSKEIGNNPAELMGKMNNHMYEIFPSLFATSYYASVDQKASQVRMTKAGHMHPLIWNEKQKDLAKDVGITTTMLSDLIHGRRNITADLALKFECTLNISAMFWMNLQSKYDLDKARKMAVTV